MRTAIVHDWLTGMRGGEKVLSLLCGLMPDADLLTLLHVPGACDERIERMRIRTSILNDLPGVKHYYRCLLPIMPMAAESIDAREYDLIVSCSHCVAKGVGRSARAAHVCYCFTPMRYVWSQQRAYGKGAAMSGAALGLLGRYLRAWDRRSASRVDLFLANSRNVADRIDRCYGRAAEVLHSPVDTGFFTPANEPREDYYLMVTALVPYKRVDLAMDAFARLDRPLRVIGTGPLWKQLRRRAPGNVTMMGWRDDDTLRTHYRRCRALIHPGEEDFGLTPLEAMASGSPAIAYGAGGALETVLDAEHPGRYGPTGVLFSPQTADALVDAVKRFEKREDAFQAPRLARWAGRFAPEKFLSGFKGSVEALLDKKGLERPW